ncbi:MAG: glycosyltransferase family 2 protein [Vulcanimicrobiaceae bacterium]
MILTRNEEAALPAAIASLPDGVAILVLDAESTDATRQVAALAGATVLRRSWTDFVDARRYALTQVRTPWALMLDADERMDEELRASLLAAGDDADAYALRRTTFFCGRALRAWRNERLVRLFRPDRVRLLAQPAAGGRSALHERWICDGRLGELTGTLLHDSYPDLASYRRKYRHYTALEAAGADGSFAKAVGVTLVAALRFGAAVALRGAWRDGWRGVYVAWWSAWYPAAVAWKALRAS